MPNTPAAPSSPLPRKSGHSGCYRSKATALVRISGCKPCPGTTLDWTPTIAPAGTAGLQTRSLKVLALDGNLRSELLNARQAVRIRRWRQPKGKPASIETVHYLTDLPPADATPDDLAKLIRGHWGIEGRLHLVRDVAFNEDHHRARTGNAPQNLAVLRNTAITLHRRNGATSIQPALRATNRKPERLLDLLPETI